MKLHIWRPKHPTKFGFHRNDDLRVLSLKFVMVRWFAREAQ